MVSKGIKDTDAAVSFQRLIIDDVIPSVFAVFDKSREAPHHEGRLRLLVSDKVDVNSEVNPHFVRLKSRISSNRQVRWFRKFEKTKGVSVEDLRLHLLTSRRADNRP